MNLNLDPHISSKKQELDFCTVDDFLPIISPFDIEIEIYNIGLGSQL